MADNQQSFLNKGRQDKFLLVLGLPKGVLKTVPGLSIRELQISVYGSIVPSISVPPINLAYQGQNLKVTSQSRASYGPLTVRFAVDNEFKNYWILWSWLNLLNQEQQSGMSDHFNKYSTIKLNDNVSKAVVNKEQGSSVYFDYMTNFTIYGLDEYNNKKIQFDYINAFITDLSEINYNYRATEEIEATATFAFNQIHSRLLVEC